MFDNDISLLYSIGNRIVMRREMMPVEPEISVFRPDRPGIRKVLGDLEAEVMELIWAHQSGEGITVRDVFAPLYQQRQIAYTTVMNTMTRLAKMKKHAAVLCVRPTRAIPTDYQESMCVPRSRSSNGCECSRTVAGEGDPLQAEQYFVESGPGCSFRQ